LLVCLICRASAIDINPRPNPFDVLEFLIEQNSDISPDNIQAKLEKLLVSPFIFFRGAPQLFYMDWTNNPGLQTYGPNQTRVFIQGDTHLDNYGSFIDDKNNVIYELNDFDEGTPNVYLYDVWRFATSLVLVAGDILSAPDTVEVVHEFAKSYRKTVGDYDGKIDPRDVAFTVDTTSGLLKKWLEEIIAKDSVKKLLDKYTIISNGQRIFDVTNPDLAPISLDLRADINTAMAFYLTTVGGDTNNDDEFYAVKDIAARLNAGTSSTGKYRYYALVEGPTDDNDDDVILDIKESMAHPSILPFQTEDWQYDYKLLFPTENDRNTIAYHAIAVHVDSALGDMFFPVTGETTARSFYCRQLTPWKETYPYADMTKVDDWVEMVGWWGKILATQHARSDRRFNALYVPYNFPSEFDKLTGGDPSKFYDEVIAVAQLYAAQVKQDWYKFSCEFDSCPPPSVISHFF